MFIRLFIWISAILFCYGIAGQSINYRVYDTENGLPSSEIYSGWQANDGKLWFTSDRGVFNYNGYSFKIYTTNEGLGNNTCFGIFPREDGTIWFTGFDGSLSYYNGTNFQVHQEITDFVKNRYLNDWIDFCVFSSDKMYFELTKTKGLYVYDFKTRKVQRPIFPDDMKTGSMAKIGNSVFYVTRLLNTSNPVYNFIRAVNIDANNYALSRGNKVYRYSLNSNRFHLEDSFDFHSFIQAKNLLVRNSFSGDFFVSAANGLFLCNFQHPKFVKQAILDNVNTNNIIQDHEGNYWASTFNRGVIFIPDIDIQSYDETIVKNEKILSIYHNNNELFAGSGSGQIFILNDNNSEQYYLDVKQRIPIEQFIQITPDKILAQRNVDRVNGKWQFKNKDPFNFQLITPYDSVSVLYSRQNAIVHYDGNVGISVADRSPLNLIKSLCYTGRKLWIGTISSLWSADYKPYQAYNYVNYGKIFPILAQRINDIQPFREGILLSVFGNGLVYFDGKKPILVVHEKLHIHNLINRILIINENQVLLLTNNGLIQIKFHSEKSFKIESVELYDVNDGLSSNFINAAFLSKGKIYLGTNKGINVVTLDRLKPCLVKPIINIIGLKTSDSIFRFSKQIILKPSQNSFIVEFEGISFKKSNTRPFYKYCLLARNSDTVWAYTNDRTIQFTNLNAEEYEFLISAQNKNSEWAPFKSMKIVVKPYFTNTWGFRFALIAWIILVSWFIYKTRRKNNLLKQEQEKKVEMMGIRAMENELMSLRNQMNPHFVFNSLNSIQRYIITNNFSDANTYITRFSKLMRTSLSMSKLEFIGLDKEIDFVSTYLDLEKLRFDNLFNYTIIIDDEVEIELTQLPSLLIQPLLENSIKHGFKNMKQGGEITLFISLFDESHLLIELTDNGKGIENLGDVLNENKSKNSFGLGIVMQRIRLLKERMNDNKISFELKNLSRGVKATLIVPVR